MRLGILSDNHGRLDPVRRAVDIFRREQVDGVAHCGDLGGPETIELLAGFAIWFVWGNTDTPSRTWRPVIEACGAVWPDAIPVLIETGGKRLALFHGHEHGFDAACRSQSYDYILHGHTHVAADHQAGRTRIINPGALHRAARKTVAVLDVTAGTLRFHDVGEV